MKFGKKLQDQLENTIPEWRPNFLSYKQLKKRLKQMKKCLKKLGAPIALIDAAIFDVHAHSAQVSTGSLIPNGEESVAGEVETNAAVESRKRKMPLREDEGPDCCPDCAEPDAASSTTGVAHRRVEDNSFLLLVRIELDKFDAFFLDKEEEFLIRLDILENRTEELQEACAGSGGLLDRCTYKELIQVSGLMIRLLGDMVLLMNYSSLNFIGLVKILKKHDKYTGAKLRKSILGSVLHQPFFSTANLNELVGRCLDCEATLRSIHPSSVDVETILPGVDKEAKKAVDFGPIPRQVEAPLQTIQPIGSD